MAKERVLNHADAEQIATKIETLAGVTPGQNDGDIGKLPSHADGTRLVTALTNLIQNRKTGHTIVNSSGTDMTARAKMKFSNATVTDDPVNNMTVITVNSGYIVYPEFNIGSDGHLTATGGAGVDYSIDANGHLLAVPL